MAADAHTLLRELLSGDPAAAGELVRRAGTTREPLVLVAAALAEPARADLLTRALRVATSSRDRQVVVVAQAFLAGDTEHVQDLAREHLADHPVDHPGSALVARLAASTPPRPDVPHHDQQEEPCTASSPPRSS